MDIDVVWVQGDIFMWFTVTSASGYYQPSWYKQQLAGIIPQPKMQIHPTL